MKRQTAECVRHGWPLHLPQKRKRPGAFAGDGPYIGHKQADVEVHPPRIGKWLVVFPEVNVVYPPSVCLSLASVGPTPADARRSNIDTHVRTSDNPACVEYSRIIKIL